MQTSKKERTKTGREKLQRIIEMCTAVENHMLDPFLINVEEIISVIREYFPEWKNIEDLCLDAEAVHHLASVIKLQSEWVKNRSTSLYTDPFLLEKKLKQIGKAEIVEVFLKVWRPTIELEQISLHSLSEAIRYWNSLLPIKERWKDFPAATAEMGFVSREELAKQKILQEKAFSEELENLWHELKTKVGENGKIPYWDFVGAESYEETVQRAFLTSFLVTYGYATLEVHPLEEEIFIKPNEKPAKISKKQLVSIPIVVSPEEWRKWRREKKQN